MNFENDEFCLENCTDECAIGVMTHTPINFEQNQNFETITHNVTFHDKNQNTNKNY